MNAAREGTRAAYGPTFRRIGCEETLQAAQGHPHYLGAKAANCQGRGIACGFWFNVGGESSAHVNVNEDGTVAITTGHPDIGGSRASMVNIVAEILGIHYRNVSAQVGDTNTIGYSASTGGSRVTFAAGTAVWQATKPWSSNCASGPPCSGTSTWKRWTGRTATPDRQAPTRAISNLCRLQTWLARQRRPVARLPRKSP